MRGEKMTKIKNKFKMNQLFLHISLKLIELIFPLLYKD